MRLVADPHMQRLRIGRGIDGARPHAETLGGPCYAAGNFAAIGNQDGFEHGPRRYAQQAWPTVWASGDRGLNSLRARGARFRLWRGERGARRPYRVDRNRRRRIGRGGRRRRLLRGLLGSLLGSLSLWFGRFAN